MTLAMNSYMNKVTAEMFSYLNAGGKPSNRQPERFYHGFVLGLMVELTDRYVLTSNRKRHTAKAHPEIRVRFLRKACTDWQCGLK